MCKLNLNHFIRYVFVVDAIAVLRELKSLNVVHVLQLDFWPDFCSIIISNLVKKEKRKGKKVPLRLTLQQQSYVRSV